MPDNKTGQERNKKVADSRRENVNAMISSKLRSYYDSIVEEGTPDHILDLLQRLDEAEQNLLNK